MGRYRRWIAAALAASLGAWGGCGFGLYDDSSAPEVTSSTTGVADAGQWWPWVCPDGSNPSPDEAPESFVATGDCGDGGTFTVNADGCELFGNWDVLGLGGVETIRPTSTPALGGWIVTATSAAAADGGFDGGVWTCGADVPAAGGAITFSCSTGSPPATICQSTLAPVGGT